MKPLQSFLLFASDIEADMEDKTETGIDKLLLMVKFISVLEAEENQVKKQFGLLKTWLSQQLKRRITNEEEIALLEGIADYLHSDPGTDERMKAMDYLFNAKFIK
jgi:hypothetical protein